MFATWGALVYRRRWLVMSLMALVTIAAGLWGSGVLGTLSQGGYDDPGSEASQVDTIVTNTIGKQTGDVVVLYTAPPGSTVDNPAIAHKITTALAGLPSKDVSKVVSYWNTGSPQLIDSTKQHGLATITLADTDQTKQADEYRNISARLTVDGVQTQIGGVVPMQQTISDRSTNDLKFAEMVSLPVVLVLLVVIFGSVIAALLPVLVGGLAILGALGVLRLISLGVDVNIFAVNVASLLGLGMAIDYGLFSVGRFREELAAGRSTAEAIRITVATAGRTVMFSATLLILALSGLTIFPLGFLKSVAYGGMSAVAIAAIVSLTVLPALLGILGPRVDALAMPWRRRSGNTARDARWLSRLAAIVMKRPVLVALPIFAVLLVLATPFLSVNFGAYDEKQLPANDPGRQAIEAINTTFPAASNSSAPIVLQGLHGRAPDQAAIHQVITEVGTIATNVQPAGAKGDVVVLTATLPGDPLGNQAKDAVTQLRAITPPADTEITVGGFSALVNDSVQSVFDRLPLMIGILVAATLIMMFLAFGSIVLPIKAVIMSTLSLGATFGVLTWVFQQGHGAGLLNVTPQPLQISVLVLIGAMIFGLSTDYETFLLSRMVEARNRGMSTPDAIRTGLLRTGTMISSAALLLIVVTGAFSLSEIVTMRFIGIGAIVALILDVTVVRLLLVPAVLRLLGDIAWWAPGPLRRWQRRVGIHETENAEHRQPQPVG